jgi:uncharacterized protein
MTEGKLRKGFACMTPEKRKEIARLGGLSVSKDKARMAEIGRTGGVKVSQDKEHMATIGRNGNRSMWKARTGAK